MLVVGMAMVELVVVVVEAIVVAAGVVVLVLVVGVTMVVVVLVVFVMIVVVLVGLRAGECQYQQQNLLLLLLGQASFGHPRRHLWRIQYTPPLKMVACPRSHTMETEKAILKFCVAVNMELISIHLVRKSLISSTQ